MRPKNKALVLEKDKARGLVPGRADGYKDKVYGSYLEKLDPRHSEDVQTALAASPDPRFREFLERITSARYKKVSLQTIAKACGIDLMEFNNWWNKASTQKAIAIAQTSSLQITADMSQDAMSVETVCDRCDGLAFVAAPSGLPETTPGYRSMTDSSGQEVWIRTCPVCVDGKVRKPGDTHSRDRILEISGLIQRGKAAVQITQNFGGAAHSSAIRDLDESMPLDITGEVLDA